MNRTGLFPVVRSDENEYVEQMIPDLQSNLINRYTYRRDPLVPSYAAKGVIDSVSEVDHFRINHFRKKTVAMVDCMVKQYL